MRVAMIVPGGVDRSGTHRVIPCLLWLLERLGRRHDVHVFAMRGRDEGRYTLRRATVHVVPGTGRRTIPTLRTVWRAHRRAAFQVFHAFWASGPGLVATIAGRLTGTPVLLHLPGGDLASIPDIDYGGRARLRDRLRVRVALAGAAHRTAPSAPVCEDAAALGYPADRLPLGVSRQEWVPRRPAPRDPRAPARLVHVGSLNRVKDQSTLLRAARRLADADLDFTLDLIGVDTLDGAMQRLAGELGIADRTRFHGFLPQERLRPLVAAADLMLFASRHEAGPVAAAEAAMIGVPSVGTAVGMLEEWAPEAAVVVPVRNADALADAALGVLRDDGRRRRIAHAAQQRAMAEDADWSARQVLDLYDRVTGRIP